MVDQAPSGEGPSGKQIGLVYFVKAEGLGLIKIGYASNVRTRLSALQAQSPDQLTLLGVMGGGPYAEAALHVAYDEDRSHGEWFRPSDDLMAFIAANAVAPDRIAWPETSKLARAQVERHMEHLP